MLNYMILFDPKRKHFKKRLKGVLAAYWDLEFQKFKLQEVREGLRMEYDKLAEQISINQTFLKVLEKYGFDIANMIQKDSNELVELALREGEEEEVRKKIGIKKLEPIKELNEKDKKIAENLKNQIKPLEDDVIQLKKQMDEMDKETEEIEKRIGSLIELQKMVKEFIKNL